MDKKIKCYKLKSTVYQKARKSPTHFIPIIKDLIVTEMKNNNDISVL